MGWFGKSEVDKEYDRLTARDEGRPEKSQREIERERRQEAEGNVQRQKDDEKRRAHNEFIDTMNNSGGGGG